MLWRIKKCLIQQRDFEKWRVQVAEQGFHRIGQSLVVQYVLEQQADDFDDIRIGRRGALELGLNAPWDGCVAGVEYRLLGVCRGQHLRDLRLQRLQFGDDLLRRQRIENRGAGNANGLLQLLNQRHQVALFIQRFRAVVSRQFLWQWQRLILANLVTQMRQHAVVFQMVIQQVVQLIELRHRGTVVNLVDDQTRRGVECQRRQGITQSFGKYRGCDRVADIADLVAAGERRKALIQSVQRFRVVGISLARHTGNCNRLFELVVVYQAQLDVDHLVVAGGGMISQKLIEGIAHVPEQGQFERAPMLLQFPARLQVAALLLIAAGLVRHTEQLLDRLVEKALEMHRGPFINERLAALQQAEFDTGGNGRVRCD